MVLLYDPAPSFDLSHEARLPDLPRLLGQPDWKPQQLLSKALLSFKTVRIDDLTDTLLDAMLRERLIAQGYISFVSCPIQIRSGKLGLICWPIIPSTHGWHEVELLQSVANQLVAIDQQNFTSKPVLLLPLLRLRLNNSGKPCKIATYRSTQATLDSTADGILVVNQVGR